MQPTGKEEDEEVRLAAQRRRARAIVTLEEMVKDRGFTVPSNWGDSSSLDEEVVLRAEKVSNENNKENKEEEEKKEEVVVLLAHFCGDASKVNTARVREYVRLARDMGVSSLLLIVSGRINPAARKALAVASREDGGRLGCEFWMEDELLFNVTKHELVPRHELLSKEETRHVLESYGLQLSMLPRILTTDPVARYYGMVRGQVVCITRRSETAGVYTIYRQVV